MHLGGQEHNPFVSSLKIQRNPNILAYLFAQSAVFFEGGVFFFQPQRINYSMKHLKPSTLRNPSSPKKRVSPECTYPNVTIHRPKLCIPITQISKTRNQNPLQSGLSIIEHLLKCGIPVSYTHLTL